MSTPFQFNPTTAQAVSAASIGFRDAVNALNGLSTGLTRAGGCGSFPSGTSVASALSELGETARDMSNRLKSAISNYNQKVVDAGGLITQQEWESQRRIAAAGKGSTPSADALGPLPGDLGAPRVAPTGPSTTDQLNAALTTGLPPVPKGDAEAAGKYPCPASPESVFGLTLDDCFQHLSSAEMSKLTMLADQWKQLSTQLTSANTTFHQVVQSQMAQAHWTGAGAPAARPMGACGEEGKQYKAAKYLRRHHRRHR